MSVLDSFLLALIGALQRHEDIDQDDRTSVQGAKEPLDFFFLLHAIDEGAEYATSSLGRHYFKHHFGS